MTLQHLRSSTAHKRPDPTAMADGQIALNTAAASPGLFYKDSAGNLVKAGPVHVGSTAPNASPASGGTAGNSTGEAWLDTSGSNPLLKIWNGSSWQTVQPVASGTVVSTADTGTVTSTMLADGTVVNADINAGAAIAHSKLASITAGSVLLGNASNVPTATALSGDVTVDSSGVTAIGSGVIVNADISASAAIAGSKIQAASTSNAGAVQLTDSTSSTSTTTAATPNAVKSAYDLANAALPKAGGALTGDVTLNAQSDLRFADADSSNWVALQGPATVTSNVTWTLPSADGTSGQVLSTNGSGTLSWATAAAGGASVTTSDTPPATPNDGDLWYDSVGGRTYVYYQDPNGSQWVDASPQGGGGSGTSITTGNTTAEVIDTGSDGRFVVTTEGTEALRVDSSRRLLVGTTSSRNVGIGASLPIQNEADYGGISVATNRNDGDSSYICLGKSRGTTAGSSTILQSGDTIGRIVFAGADGTDMQSRAAEISAWVDGTPGVDDMPGRLIFATTADGAASPTERVRIDSTGLVTLTGPGIKFPATQVASADPNVLDDYEEGTWTPTVGGTATYTKNTGNYTKLGRLVNVSFELYINTIGTGSQWQIFGLPFTATSTGSQSQGGSVGYINSLATNIVSTFLRADAGDTYLVLASLTAAGTFSANNNILGNGSRIYASITYMAS